MDFETYWTLIGGDVNFSNRKASAERAWSLCAPEKRQAIIHWLQKRGRYPGRNPYFFILDFQVTKREEPTNYNGKALPEEPVFSAKYNGKWGMYTQEDIDKYHLETMKTN